MIRQADHVCRPIVATLFGSAGQPTPTSSSFFDIRRTTSFAPAADENVRASSPITQQQLEMGRFMDGDRLLVRPVHTFTNPQRRIRKAAIVSRSKCRRWDMYFETASCPCRSATSS